MLMNKTSLQYMFEMAIRENAPFIGIQLAMKQFDGLETIINPTENFKSKLKYYNDSYDKDLTLKACKDIKIVGIYYGTLEDIHRSFNNI